MSMELSQSSFDRLNRKRECVATLSCTEAMKYAVRVYEYLYLV